MKKLLLIIIVCALGIMIMLKEKGPTWDAVSLNVAAKSVLLMEAETGKVLYEENSKEALPIASMSKMMTQYLVLNAIESGALSWESTYEPSEYVQQAFESSAIVKLGLSAGNTYTIKELFTAMTVISANDAAVALAEMVAGTEEAFVGLMNEQAKAFKLKKTTFYNATGLDGNYIGKAVDETNLSTAHDVAIIAQKLIEKHPTVLDFSKITDFAASNGNRLWSTNLMLPGMPDAMSGIDGLKTGFTDEAGPCFASTGVFEGRRIISVVINVEADGTDTVHPKFQLTRELFERFVLS